LRPVRRVRGERHRARGRAARARTARRAAARSQTRRCVRRPLHDAPVHGDRARLAGRRIDFRIPSAPPPPGVKAARGGGHCVAWERPNTLAYPRCWAGSERPLSPSAGRRWATRGPAFSAPLPAGRRARRARRVPAHCPQCTPVLCRVCSASASQRLQETHIWAAAHTRRVSRELRGRLWTRVRTCACDACRCAGVTVDVVCFIDVLSPRCPPPPSCALACVLPRIPACWRAAPATGSDSRLRTSCDS